MDFLLTYRSLQTRLDKLKPDCDAHVIRKQADQNIAHDRRDQDHEWFLGQSEMVRNLRQGQDWFTEVIVERLGPLPHMIETEEYQFWKQIDNLKEMKDSCSKQSLSSTEFEVIPDCDYHESKLVIVPQSPERETISHEM